MDQMMRVGRYVLTPVMYYRSLLQDVSFGFWMPHIDRSVM